jgi:hypothetical protein
VVDLGYTEDAKVFGLLRIQSFLKKAANCELMHCENARESTSMLLCDSTSRYFAGYPEEHVDESTENSISYLWSMQVDCGFKK